MDGIGELLGRVKAATGPDRKIDETIARLGGWTATGKAPPTTGIPEYWYSDAFGMPRYTASVDAALALVERVLPGAMRRLQDASDGSGHGEATLVLTDSSVVSGRGRTWPLAILAALLAALNKEPTP